MKHTQITLDYDYYMLGVLEQYKSQVVNLLKQICSDIVVYNTKKGLNIIATLKTPIEVDQLLLFRLMLYDDLFRIRNEVSKIYDNQEHRINRIWLAKDGHEKAEIFRGDIKDFDIIVFQDMLELIKTKQPKKKND